MATATEIEPAITPVGRLQTAALFVVLILAAAAVIAMHVSPLWRYAFLIHFGTMMLLLAVVAVADASLMVGYRNALVFLALGVGIGFTAETVGVFTGWPFGAYHYTQKLGREIGVVPWVIPFCWFALVYFAHVIVNLAVHAHPVTRTRNLIRCALQAVLTALVATGFDVAMDPAMSHWPVNAWIWIHGGNYLGVPFQNFRGWVLTAFVIDFAYRLFTGWSGDNPISKLARTTSLVLLLTWFAMGLGYVMIGHPVATQLVAVFCIFLPGLLALASLYLRAWNPEAIETSR